MVVEAEAASRGSRSFMYDTTMEPPGMGPVTAVGAAVGMAGGVGMAAAAAGGTVGTGAGAEVGAGADGGAVVGLGAGGDVGALGAGADGAPQLARARLAPLRPSSLIRSRRL